MIPCIAKCDMITNLWNIDKWVSTDKSNIVGSISEQYEPNKAMDYLPDDPDIALNFIITQIRQEHYQQH